MLYPRGIVEADVSHKRIPLIWWSVVCRHGNCAWESMYDVRELVSQYSYEVNVPGLVRELVVQIAQHLGMRLGHLPLQLALLLQLLMELEVAAAHRL